MARLATIGPGGRPHLVPITFALDGDTIYTAVDQKRKVTTRLQRLRNVATDPRVSVLADHYDDEDWSSLWWVRADGAARVVTPGDPEHELAVTLVSRPVPALPRASAAGPGDHHPRLELDRVAGDRMSCPA